MINREAAEKEICLNLIMYPSLKDSIRDSFSPEELTVCRTLFSALMEGTNDIDVMERAGMTETEYAEFLRTATPGIGNLAPLSELVKMVKEDNAKIKLRKELEDARTELENGNLAAAFNLIHEPDPIAEEYQPVDVMEMLRGFEEPETWISTGFNNLNQSLGGGMYEGVYIFSAMTGVGKTAFASQILDSIAESGTDTLQFAFEMPKQQLLARSFSRYMHLMFPDKTTPMLNQLLRGNLDEGSWNMINAAVEEYGKRIAAHTYIVECDRSYTIDRIRDGIGAHIRRTGRTPVCMIDYLQILPRENKGNDAAALEAIISELKNISRKYKTVIIVISSQARDSYNKTPDLTCFKGSGSIEYSGDVAAALYRDNDNPGIISLRILKNRHNNGSVDTDIMFTFSKYGNFKEINSIPAN